MADQGTGGPVCKSRGKSLQFIVAVEPLFWSGASFLVALLISLIKIERIIRGVAGRVIALYRPNVPEDLATGSV